MADDLATPRPEDERLRALCQETHELIRRIPGGVRRLSLRTGDHALEIEWDPEAGAGMPPPTGTVTVAADGEGQADDDHEGYVLTAPLVGAFYRSPQPGAPPFVEVGDVVEAGQDVAIIEAMKIMNNIQTERGGTVTRILVENGDVVEFAQELMVIQPLQDG